jgi:hypothetical protein
MVGLSGDQIFQRRRVWERFGSVYANFEGLKWSFFYVALTWDDAEDCLTWLARAMQRSPKCVHGDGHRGAKICLRNHRKAIPNGPRRLGLTHQKSPSAVWSILQNSFKVAWVTCAGLGGFRTGAATMDAVARDATDSSYAPFRADAGGTGPKADAPEPGARRAELTPEQFWKRASSMLDKLSRALTPGLMKALPEQSDAVQEKLREAIRELSEKLEGALD